MEQSNQCDVLILGAGAAGLNAAAELSKKHRVIVLEARDRVGGRLFTRHHPEYSVPVELGPEFVHGHASETFDLLREAGLVAYDLAEKHETSRKGKLVSQDDLWEDALELMTKVKKLRKDISFDEFLTTAGKNAKPQIKQMAIGYVEGFNAARSELIICQSLAKAAAEEEKEDGDKQYRLVGGYNQLAEALAKRIQSPSRVDLQTVVKHAKWRMNDVEVTANTQAGERTYTAKKLIIALPLGILQAPDESTAGVRFEPELSYRHALRDKLIMGQVTKITIRFREAFWEKLGHKDLSFVHVYDLPFPTWWSQLPLRTSVLVGWSGGAQTDKLRNGEYLDQAAESLAKIFAISRKKLLDQIETYDLHDWQRDPFSKGAYSYAAVGGADLPDQLARPIQQTIFTAGEHTHAGLLGTVAGALHSGKRAAKQVMRTMTNV